MMRELCFDDWSTVKNHNGQDEDPCFVFIVEEPHDSPLPKFFLLICPGMYACISPPTMQLEGTWL